ncbi:hypothetical protein M409DRAFT_28976 [Zasmidium cellare ATCC 36951]|uniref:Uncharacterized protein n=1 Tax=Zasmidium cellare ATCC 36951 TaxID=1080233 RepID=A0A6A6C328_ZASCE|nr:uncharacterized protein M409DRAFT_28976 [Zasmidium cellare ATCC 36951]KAF2160590.1 hypothetical protein M409DRAFT_28976 [Zasmidium cellare ATCC 36951]
MPEDDNDIDWTELKDFDSSKHYTSSSLQSDVVATQPPPWLDNIQEFASRSADKHLSSGDHLDCFVQYLNQPYDPRFQDSQSASTEQRAFGVLYDFRSASIQQVLQNAGDLDDLKAQREQDVPESRLLILRGHPSPEWLNAISDAFEVDIEFFHHHLELFSRSRADPAWTWPPLSSTLAREPRLRITTHGTVNKPEHHAREEKHVNGLRSHVREIFKAYLEDTQREVKVHVGTSLLRDIHVHGAETFSFEQDVSIWTKQLGNGWRGVAWIDVGIDDLFQGPKGASLRTPLGGKPENTIFGSTVLCRASETDFLSHDAPAAVHKGVLETPDGITQNARHLSHQYCQDLDLALARADSFYAVRNLFRFSAASENQFLNMMQSVIRDDIHHATVLAKEKRADASLSNLLSNQLVLSDHVKRLEDNLLAIQRRDEWPKWRGSSSDILLRADKAGSELLDNYQGLLRKATALAEECDRGIRRIEHLESYAESKRAIAQAQGVEKLTRLAFVFVPMSFSCAFFGMNFKEIGQGTLSLWVWFAVTVPIFVLSLVLMVSNLRRRVSWYLGLRGRQTHVGDPDLEQGHV